jgi:hypothetical protein
MNVRFTEPFVNLIEPNNVDINTKIVNGVPQYQDMYIFAELTAVRKARTVLVKTEDNKYKPEKTGLEDTVTVNFLGNNQNIGVNNPNPNYLNFTTNYYQGSSGNETQYEGFGITDIKVVINSSFVPQVNIQFVDIRGVALFNQPNSPYRILFDFPPPVFELIIKGYYGKALTYRLHLVKYTSEFKSENGNFVIDAQFIAVTYAPLTDVLFRYAINFPIMKSNVENQSASPAPDKRPRNTNELITKLKALMPAIANAVNSGDESNKYNEAIKKIANNDDVLLMLSAIKEDVDLLKNGDLYLLLQDNSPENANGGNTSKISVLNNTSQYDTYIQEQFTVNQPKDINKRLIIGYYVGPDINLRDNTTVDGDKGISTPKYRKLQDKQIEDLNLYRTNLINRIRSNASAVQFDDADIGNAKPFTDTYDITKNVNVSPNLINYDGIDITDLYFKLQKNNYFLKQERYESASAINVKVNNIVLEELGMMPTIYNIFKIILDDVDIFFQTIRDTSVKAEDKHHNIPDYYNIITGGRDYGDSTKLKRVFAFPLIINRTAVVCGGNREERIAPIELSKRLPKPFPEMELINEFIDSFYMQDFAKNLPYLKTEKNDDGTNVWIPISPFDSELGSDTTGTPYTTDGITISTNGDDKIAEIIRKFLQRFYILSQSSLFDSFYGPDYNTRSTYINLFSQSEAVNMATSIVNPTYREALKKLADDIKTNGVNSFYDVYLGKSKTLQDIYDFRDGTVKSMPLSNIDNVYVDRSNSGYTGVFFPKDKPISIQVDQDSDDTKKTTTDKPVKKYLSEVKKNKLLDFKGKYPESFYNFTNENVIYVEDIWRNNSNEVKNKMDVVNDVCLHTRFLSDTEKNIDMNDANILLAQGNVGINNTSGSHPIGGDINNLKSFENVVDVWVEQLSKYDKIISGATATQSKLANIMFLSNFGYTLGPFNVYPKALNRLVFNNPAVIEIPTYLAAYIGALVDADTDTDFMNDLKDFFINGDGKNIDNNGLYIFADIYDVNHNLSQRDKERFQTEYSNYIDDWQYQILTQFNLLIKSIPSGVTSVGDKKDIYTELINPIKSKNGAQYYNTIIEPLMKRVPMANYSQITFKIYNYNNPYTYSSLRTTNHTSKKGTNDMFFTSFFTKLSSEIDVKQKETKDQEDKNRRLKGDEDIITQTYYSFKNINDKWLANPEDTQTYGYPFNLRGNKLIDSFVFVDRAMNPIGDTIINPEALIQMYEDPNLSVFSVISQLLSANGFEFFPLQNFMKYTDNEWQECFKIDTGTIAKNKQAFVCMFIGGSSSYPSNISGGFEDDGIIDLEHTSATDFNTSNCAKSTTGDDPKDNQVNRYPDFPWREVRAFKVRFGEQNQSMFTGIKIDSKEFPETNESIQILSKLAGDGGAAAPVPKGQNLYNIYENRAYRATVSAMGNAMIQPTQYFQIENVPMFNGAYVILTVEHNITPNKMMTSFSGTKVLRFPFPRVMSPAAIFGLKDGSSDMTSTVDMSSGQMLQKFGGAQYLDDLAKVESMYSLKIQ